VEKKTSSSGAEIEVKKGAGNCLTPSIPFPFPAIDLSRPSEDGNGLGRFTLD
jgi:hypothetical protein